MEYVLKIKQICIIVFRSHLHEFTNRQQKIGITTIYVIQKHFLRVCFQGTIYYFFRQCALTIASKYFQNA